MKVIKKRNADQQNSVRFEDPARFTQHGERVVLRGLGLPQLNGSRRGDQYVLFSVVVPANLSDEQRDALERAIS